MEDRTHAKRAPKTSPAYAGAYRRGAEAAATGKTQKACPYPKDNPISAAFRRYWLLGYLQAKGLPTGDITVGQRRGVAALRKERSRKRGKKGA